MIRVASLKDMVHAGYTKTDIAGMTPKEQLAAISVRPTRWCRFSTTPTPVASSGAGAGGTEGDQLHEDLTPEQAKYVDDYFEENIYPVLTPMAMGFLPPVSADPEQNLNIGALIQKKEKA